MIDHKHLLVATSQFLVNSALEDTDGTAWGQLDACTRLKNAWVAMQALTTSDVRYT